MRKVYKLKQWYPGLPNHWKVGKQVFETNKSVENNPDYWELVQKTSWTIEEINDAIEKWKFGSKNEEMLLVSEIKSEFGL